MKKILIGTTIFTILMIGGCSSNTAATSSSTKTTPSNSAATNSSSSTSSNVNSTTSTTVTTGDMTIQELAKYNGQNGSLAYVAVSGVIYDVSNSKEWRNGMHKNGIKAGVDLTKMIGQSPHGVSVLKNLPVIGKLK